MPKLLTRSDLPARNALKNGYFRALAFARVDWIMREIHARAGTVLVINLHRVSPVPNPYWAPLTPEAFEALTRFLSSSCHCATFADLPVTAPTHRPVVILSFDDGCRDFIEYAMPILERHRIRANHNVIGESIETGRPPWTIMLSDALNAASHQRIDGVRIAGFPARLMRYDEVSKARFGTGLSNFLKAITPLQRRIVWPAVQALLDDTPPHRWTEMMSATDLQEVADAHELGGHSYSHESMGHLDDAAFSADFDRCRLLFEAMGRRVKVYAFPNDSYRPSQVSILQESGVEHVLVGPGGQTNMTGLYRRLPIYGGSAAELRLRAMAAPFPKRI